MIVAQPSIEKRYIVLYRMTRARKGAGGSYDFGFDAVVMSCMGYQVRNSVASSRSLSHAPPRVDLPFHSCDASFVRFFG